MAEGPGLRPGVLKATDRPAKLCLGRWIGGLDLFDR